MDIFIEKIKTNTKISLKDFDIRVSHRQISTHRDKKEIYVGYKQDFAEVVDILKQWLKAKDFEISLIRVNKVVTPGYIYTDVRLIPEKGSSLFDLDCLEIEVHGEGSRKKIFDDLREVLKPLASFCNNHLNTLEAEYNKIKTKLIKETYEDSMKSQEEDLEKIKRNIAKLKEIK